MDILRLQGSDEWNFTELTRCFAQEEVALISQLKLGAASQHGFVWSYNHNGSYTVKSGYWLWTVMKEELNPELMQHQEPSMEPIYRAIWSCNSLPRVQHFLWQCMTNCLAVGENMKKKRLTASAECPRCGEREESVNHLLFQCPFARLVWALSPLGFPYHPQPSDSIYANMAAGLCDFIRGDEDMQCRLRLWPWIVWRLWKARNTLCFSNQTQDAQNLLDQCIRDKEDWEATTKTTMPQNPSPPQRLGKWEPPPSGSLKCNVDASWYGDKELCTVGWVLRDHVGNAHWYGYKAYPKLLSCLEAEATGLVWAKQCMENLGMEQVIFETDSLLLYQALMCPVQWPRLKTFTDDLLFPSTILKPSFKHVGRERNKCADRIAAYASCCRMYEAVLGCVVPNWLKPWVDSEKPL